MNLNVIYSSLNSNNKQEVRHDWLYIKDRPNKKRLMSARVLPVLFVQSSKGESGMLLGTYRMQPRRLAVNVK